MRCRGETTSMTPIVDGAADLSEVIFAVGEGAGVASADGSSARSPSNSGWERCNSAGERC